MTVLSSPPTDSVATSTMPTLTVSSDPSKEIGVATTPDEVLSPTFDCNQCDYTNISEKGLVQHIVPWLSEGTWWSSHNVMNFLGSSGGKHQLPGHLESD